MCYKRFLGVVGFFVSLSFTLTLDDGLPTTPLPLNSLFTLLPAPHRLSLDQVLSAGPKKLARPLFLLLKLDRRSVCQFESDELSPPINKRRLYSKNPQDVHTSVSPLQPLSGRPSFHLYSLFDSVSPSDTLVLFISPLAFENCLACGVRSRVGTMAGAQWRAYSMHQGAELQYNIARSTCGHWAFPRPRRRNLVPGIVYEADAMLRRQERGDPADGGRPFFYFVACSV